MFFGVPGGSRKERRDAIAKRRCLHRKRSVSRGGFCCRATHGETVHDSLRIQKQPRLRLFFGVPGGSRKERRDAIAKRRCLHRKRSVSRGGFCCRATHGETVHDSLRIQKQPRLRLFFGVPGGSRTLDTRRRRPVLYPTELRIRL